MRIDQECEYNANTHAVGEIKEEEEKLKEKS